MTCINKQDKEIYLVLLQDGPGVKVEVSSDPHILILFIPKLENTIYYCFHSHFHQVDSMTHCFLHCCNMSNVR